MSLVLDGLNEAQTKAVVSISGPVLVAAGPGTGKTLTLVRRIAYLVEQGARPEEILAVTFTNRTAREMRERVMGYLGSAASGMFIGTFHLLGLRIMRENLADDFTVCDRVQQVGILEGLTGSRKKAEQAADRISRIKSFINEPGEIETGELLRAYESELRRRALYDFDDLIQVPLEILGDEAVAVRYRKVFRHVMVDEYQDINPAQYRLTRRLTDSDGNICVVGDSDQAIYAFRGADISSFLNFGTDFPGAQTVILTRNYRSSKTILDASSGLIRNNKRRIEKDLDAAMAAGTEIKVISVSNEKKEAEIIVGEIEERIGGTSHLSLSQRNTGFDLSDGSYGFSDFAVIFRTNAQAGALEEAFFESGIPYQVVRGADRAGIRDVAEALKGMAGNEECAADPDGLVSVLCEERGIGENDRALLRQITAAYGGLSAREVLTAVSDELALLSTGDSYDPRAHAVTLMTMHAAKGLEFRVVFIAGVEDGLVPLLIARGEADDAEEERRLFYVGMTRAKEELILTHARSRSLYGRRRAAQPSSFLREIPEGLMRRKAVEDKPLSPKQKQMKLF